MISSKIKLVVCDLDGVLLRKKRFFTEILIEKYKIEAKNSLIKDFVKSLHEAETTEGDEFEIFQKNILEPYDISLEKKVFFDMWFSGEGITVDTKVLDVLQDFSSSGISIVALSDNIKARIDWLKKNLKEDLYIFHKIYYPKITGATKEEGAIEYVLKDTGLKPEEVLNIDDSEEDLKPTKDLGVDTILFKNSEDLNNISKQN